jgi:hypothetical protein
VLRSLDVLEQEGGAAGLDGAVDNLGDLEVRIDLDRNANQLSLPFEQVDPAPEVGRRGHPL